MPIYEYRCRVCGATLDVLVRGSQAVTCPHCGSAALDKLMSAPFVLSGQTARSPGHTCCGREERCDTPPDEAGLMRAMAILGNIAQVVHPAEGTFDLSGYNSVVDAIVSIITRHPMREDELVRALERWMPGTVEAALQQLAASEQAQRVERYGVRFWSAAPSDYPDPARSQVADPGDSCRACSV